MSGHDEAERERVIDARVQRRLATDAAYRNAANAEEQSEREEEIERQEIERYDRQQSPPIVTNYGPVQTPEPEPEPSYVLRVTNEPDEEGDYWARVWVGEMCLRSFYNGDRQQAIDAAKRWVGWHRTRDAGEEVIEL